MAEKQVPRHLIFRQIASKKLFLNNFNVINTKTLV